MPKKGGGNTVQIVQRHHFASHLKRTAVVVRTEEKFYAFVKAAPETIQERLNDTPAYYVSTYKRYTRQGSHVLALAYKPLPDMTVSEARNLDREVVESGLTFAGFAKMEQEKLEKLARKGQKAEGASGGSGGSSSGADANASGSTASSSSAAGVSTDNYKNYAVVAGLVTGLGALGWYLKSKDKKTEEVHD